MKFGTAQPKRIIVRSPNWIGDQIMAFPFFHYLRQAYPNAHIAAACVPWVASIQFQKLVDEIIILEPPQNKNVSTRWIALQKAQRLVHKRGSWDLGICLPNSFSSAWIFYRAGVKRVRGYSTDARRLLLKEPLSWAQGSELHRTDAYLALLPEVSKPRGLEFWGGPAEDPLDPPIPGVIDRFHAAEQWNLNRLGQLWSQPKNTNSSQSSVAIEPPRGEYWIMAPGTTAQSRQWPLEHYRDLALKLEKLGLKGLIVGGPKEKAIAKKLVAQVGPSLQDWTALGPVSANWKLFEKARFTVSNDSGLAHMASLCGCPVQIVWGAGNPARTRPIGPGRVFMQFNAVSCWPCTRNSCSQPQGAQLRCLQGVSADDVCKEIQAVKF